MIRAESISVCRDGRPVLNNLDLRVELGEVVAIQGASGAGKSTLLATLCGLVATEGGELWVEGARFDQVSDRTRSAIRLRRFGMVFQGDELFRELTIGENLSLPLRLTQRPRRTAHYLKAAHSVLSRLGIEDLVERMPSDVSGGQLQRAAVARAVIHRPSVVLADEPTASLDEAAARSAMQLLIDLARASGSAVVVVTHDDVVARRCDRRLLLIDGRLEATDDAPCG